MLLVRNVLPRGLSRLPPVVQRQLGQIQGLFKGNGCRQFETTNALDMPDPDRTVGGGAQHCGFTPAQQFAGLAAQARLRPGVKQMAGLAKEGVRHTGEAVRRMQLGQHGGG